jgi:hypothetical protein
MEPNPFRVHVETDIRHPGCAAAATLGFEIEPLRGS